MLVEKKNIRMREGLSMVVSLLLNIIHSNRRRRRPTETNQSILQKLIHPTETNRHLVNIIHPTETNQSGARGSVL